VTTVRENQCARLTEMWSLPLRGQRIVSHFSDSSGRILLTASDTGAQGRQGTEYGRILSTCVSSDGTTLWERAGLHLVGVRPDGLVDAIEEDRHLIVDPDGGKTSSGHAPGGWCLVNRDQPRRSRIVDSRSLDSMDEFVNCDPQWGENLFFWRGTDSVMIADHRLKRQLEVPIPWNDLPQRWLDSVSDDKILDELPENLIYEYCGWQPIDWRLSYDPFNDSLLLASGRPAWLISISRHGDVRWSTLVGFECCSLPCIAMNRDRLVFASSCGKRLTFITESGTVVKRRNVSYPFLPRHIDYTDQYCLHGGKEGVFQYDHDGEMVGFWPIDDESRGTVSVSMRQNHTITATTESYEESDEAESGSPGAKSLVLHGIGRG